MDDGMTLQEIGDAMGISRQAVDQLLNRAFAKLRRRLAARGIMALDDILMNEHIIPALRAGNRPRD